ncbi:MlaD family protein [Leptolyngbya sp. 15MV]|nr:MlaD family protein [Leptolyngbya sp. 15MV]
MTLVLLAALAFFIIWLAQLSRGSTKDYDIFFKQSVSGLAKGSQVAFAGVPVGQVKEIVLSEDDPEFVRVRIAVRDEVPILQPDAKIGIQHVPQHQSGSRNCTAG